MSEDFDSNIVPLGRKGRVGRGNAKTTPSAAARALAGPGPSKKPSANKGAAKKPASARAEAVESSEPHPPRLRIAPDAGSASADAAEEAMGQDSGNDDLPFEEIGEAVLAGVGRLLGEDWQDRAETALSEFRRRIGGEFAVDEFGFDEEFTRVLVDAAEPLIENWFRLQVRGVENIPESGGALLVSNHSGTIPVDGVVMGYAIRKHAQRNLRPLAADLVFALPFIGQAARKLGATLACAEDAERLLTKGELAAVWPEGFKGIGKPYSERYKLQRFGRGGFVSSAMRAGVPIIPVSIVGAEEIYPLVGNVPSLARLLGVPYLPITPFFPWLGPLGLIPLPSKWVIEFGEPIRTDAYEPEAADDPMLLFEVTDQVRETIQQTLYKLLIERGNPFI